MAREVWNRLGPADVSAGNEPVIYKQKQGINPDQGWRNIFYSCCG
jgi:hypothetical protein